MKKLLSVLLVLAIALGCMVGAAAKSTERPQARQALSAEKYQAFDPALLPDSELTAQGLNNPLQVITNLEALWSGDTIVGWNFTPYFDLDNLKITVTFDGGETEVLEKWWDEGNDWWWEIGYEYDDATGSVTVFYIDSELYEAYLDTLGDDYDDYDWEDLLATLPQDTVTVPAGQQALLLAAVPKLKLDEGKTPTMCANDYKVLAFTPETSGAYTFYSYDNTADPVAELYDGDFNYLSYNDDGGEGLNFSITAQLTAGKTYYLYVLDYDDDGACKVMVTKAVGGGYDSGLVLSQTTYTLRYGTVVNIFPVDFIVYSEYGYYEILVNGDTLDWGYSVYGVEPGDLMTFTYTDLDGEVLATLDIVCTLSPLQWIAYYLLGGFLWMPRLPMVYENWIPGMWDSFVGFWQSVWFGIFR